MGRTMRLGSLAWASFVLVALSTAGKARAGTFDVEGVYHADPEAVVFFDFTEEVERFLPEDAEPECREPAYEQVVATDAIEGDGLLKLNVEPNCAERFVFSLPAEQASYAASLWMRHGSLGARISITYTEESGLEPMAVQLAPTGRATSDGWVELASNEFPVDGALIERAFLRVNDYGAVDATEIDAFEIVRAGTFVEPVACTGVDDPVCGPEAFCGAEKCRIGRLSVPPLPPASIRNEVVDMLVSRVGLFFGGRRSRLEFMPTALETLESMRKAETAWEFWSRWARAVRQLHDWHTNARLPLGFGSPRRLNACFIEGDADLTHAVAPADAKYPDVLVSHAGTFGALGLVAGDRLVAIDGKHPIQWAIDLASVDLGWHVATDPDVYAELVEQLGGPQWLGGSLILKFAESFTVVRCDPALGTCASQTETIDVASIQYEGGDDDVACDNRPSYHFGPNAGPNPGNHYVFWDFHKGPIADTTPEEAIYGLLWDTLYGGSDPNGWVNGNILGAWNEFKAGARGVILDHRAGSGGTLDAAENVTKLVRPPEPYAIIRMPIEIAGDFGPADLAAGKALFDEYKNTDHVYTVGAADHDPLLPVALIVHRDGSASDYMPYGMKGAPKVRVFGPHATAGAFSTFIEFWWWGGVSFQIASGDTIGFDGQALIGHGVMPDELVQLKQSDLLAGKDTLHEAALEWVRQELKP